MRKCIFIYDGELGQIIESTAEGEELPLGGRLE